MAQSDDGDIKSQKVEEYNKFFSNVGKNTFEKSQQHVRNNNASPHTDHQHIPNSNITPTDPHQHTSTPLFSL